MKEDTPHGKADLLLHLCSEVSRIAGSLAQLSIGAGALPRQTYPNCNEHELDVPLDRVNWLIHARQRRACYFTPEVFADPAWDILLDLLRAEIANERISVSSACIAASVPLTTGLRWLRALEQRGLVLLEPDLGDAQRALVSLTKDSSIALRRYFLEVVGTPPPERR